MTTWTDLQHYVNDLGTSSQTFLEECVRTATALVDTYIGAAVVPADVKKAAVLEVGSKLYQRRNAPDGSYSDPTLTPAPLAARDPMVTAYPILNRYIVAGI